MSDLDRDDWATVLDGLEEPTLGTVAEGLADALELTVGSASDRVEAAIDEEILVEEDTGGAFDTIRLAKTEAFKKRAKSARETSWKATHAGPNTVAIRGEDSDTGYLVETEGTEALACSCPDYEHNVGPDGKCKHMIAYEEQDTDEVDIDPPEREESDEADEPDESAAEDTDTEGADPSREAALDAFGDAIEFYHGQLDREIPVEYAETAREYFEDVRGWDTDTVEEKQLGYAPADCKDELITYLHDRGHDREAILASGLFYEDGLAPHFSGRFVLPYFDKSGEPVYAISRSIDEDDDGHPGDHHGNQKYTKALKGKEYSALDEPIYGLSSVDHDTDELLVAGGIADAITLHEAGFACISPVTTVRFKADHEERVLDLVKEYGIDRVYMVNDAERPTVDGRELEDAETPERIGDVLTIQQFGEGLRGAFGNADFLEAANAKTYLVDLPAGDDDLRKLDPDDYVKEGWGAVETLLASATPAAHHAGYSSWQASRRERAIDDAARSTPDPSASSGSRSALFDLDIEDVTGEKLGFRGNNPLGHHGDSENYFVIVEKRGDRFGYDHKHGVAYNGMTYLACEAGERRASDPNGMFDDEAILETWAHAKAERYIDDDDAIPTRALEYAARTFTDWNGEFVERETADGDTFDALPADVYNDALDAVAEEYGVDPGREHLTHATDPDAEPVAPLPFKQLDALAGADRERAAKKRDVEIPSTREAREELRNAIFREVRAENTTVLDAPTALGKTYTVASEPWRRRESTTGGAPVIHLHATTPARDDALAATRDSSASGAVLRGRKEASPLARGDHDPTPEADGDPDVVVTIDGEPASEWFDHQCDEKGLPFSTALALARDRNDQGLDELPPIGEEDPAVAQWDGLPRDDDGEAAVDVIHATHQFAHVPSLRSYTNVVLDEQPDYTVDLDQERVRRMVNAYLRAIGAPVSTFGAFATLARGGMGGGDAGREADRVDELLDTDHDLGAEWVAEEPDAHALAPDLTRALWGALRYEESDANGRRSSTIWHEPPRFDADDEAYNAGAWLSVVVDDENTVRRVRSAPDFREARSVVGLDAHPSMPRWQLNTGPNKLLEMFRDDVLDPTERRLWRRYERGLTVVQVGDATRPRSGSKALDWMNDDRVRAVVERLREEYGSGFKTALATAQTEASVRSILGEVAPDVDAENTMHFGEEKSRNDFADEDAGYVYGCMDPGDDMVLDAIAELGLDAAPERAETDAGEEYRAKGRGFVGDDADTADAVLASVRENHVAQAAGRYARNADDPEDRATCYVHTDAAPDGFVDVEAPGVEWLASELQREVVETLSARPSATASEISEAVGCSKRHVLETLSKLEERDLVERERGAGHQGADVYRGEDAEAGAVDLGEVTNDHLEGFSRYFLVTCDPHAPDESEPTAAEVDETARGVVAGGDDPPGGEWWRGETGE